MKKNVLTLITAMGAAVLVGCSTAKPQPEPPAKLVVEEVKENCYNALIAPVEESGRALLESDSLFYYSSTCDQGIHSLKEVIEKENAYPEYKTHKPEDGANADTSGSEVESSAAMKSIQEEAIKDNSFQVGMEEYDLASKSMEDDSQQKPGQLILGESDATIDDLTDIKGEFLEADPQRSNIKAAPIKGKVELPRCSDVTAQTGEECIEMDLEIRS